jgi:hypothetical protein
LSPLRKVKRAFRELQLSASDYTTKERCPRPASERTASFIERQQGGRIEDAVAPQPVPERLLLIGGGLRLADGE